MEYITAKALFLPAANRSNVFTAKHSKHSTTALSIQISKRQNIAKQIRQKLIKKILKILFQKVVFVLFISERDLYPLAAKTKKRNPSLSNANVRKKEFLYALPNVQYREQILSVQDQGIILGVQKHPENFPNVRIPKTAPKSLSLINRLKR